MFHNKEDNKGAGFFKQLSPKEKPPCKIKEAFIDTENLRILIDSNGFANSRQ